MKDILYIPRYQEDSTRSERYYLYQGHKKIALEVKDILFIPRYQEDSTRSERYIIYTKVPGR